MASNHEESDPAESINRRRLLGLMGLGGAVALAGCSGGNDGSGNGGGGSTGDGSESGGGGSPSGEPLGSERIGYSSASNTVNYWTQEDFIHTAENTNLGSVHEGMLTTWAEEHPDWKINVQIQTNLEQFKTKLLQANASNNAPPMSEVDSFWVPQFYGDLASVDEAMQEYDDWYPFVENVAKNEGSWRAVWQNTDCRALYYRKDLLDEYNEGNPPETWDELVDVGSAIADGENMNGYMYNGGRWEATTFDNLAHFWALGGTLIDDQGAPVLDESENRSALVEVMKWFKRTIDSGITPQRVANINDYAQLREAALNDQTAMFLGGNWQISTMKSMVDEDVWSNWKVAPIPQKNADIAATGVGGWTKGVFTDDEEQRKVAVDLYSLFTDSGNMAQRCREGGFLPTRQSVFEENEFFSEDEYFQVYSKLLENGRARPGYPIYTTVSSEWQIAAGEVITGQSDPETAVRNMINNVNSEYDG
ncbi:extracellular solute-binding protein [Halogeometricum luteum]|uniref:Extracellular solute-binding protein n=1 Tax=Halogeometricum luteum TaxID=2950537 RepID=A0ABU2G3Q4_9EURY|nr:extracellular solute-binding protein [Halogeometricum sp. S3BR5-2]MDS0295417.1 extracellular solute-binding protein [Halogeometricum sp. S3BR5-2]